MRSAALLALLSAASLFAACGDDTGTQAGADASSNDGPGGDDASHTDGNGIHDGSPGDAPSDSGGGDTGTSDASDGSSPSTSDVLQHHKNPSRDGLYVDPALPKSAIATLHRDSAFAATVTSNVYAQPLYVENGPGSNEAFYVATERNHLVAIDKTGAAIWDKTFSSAVTGNLPCGNINPLGITGTPVIDLASRTLYFDAMTTPNNNQTIQHMVYAVSIDDGTTKSGWPVDIDASVSGFQSRYQNQRGALQLVGGVLYVPYGGHFGDCNPYHGWVVGIPVANPSTVTAWHTSASRGGIWSTGGLPSDGTNVYASTGNTSGVSSWGGGEAILRFGPGPAFSNQSADYFYPSNWQSLDNTDLDLGGANPILVDMPGAPVPHLVVALGKDGNMYLLDRANLGGAGGALSVTQVADGELNAAAAAYTTSQGTYVAFHVDPGATPHNCPVGGQGNLGVAKIAAGNPPSASVVWCSDENDLGSPMVTTTNGTSDAIVWDANARLYGYDGDTGAKVFAGGGAGDAMAGNMQYFNTPIDTKGRIVVATSGHLYVFRP